MGSFAAVLVDFDTTVNPEPGIARAPTADEQFAALERLVHRHGHTLAPEALVTRRGVGLEPEQLARLNEREGVALFSLDTLRRRGRIDVHALRRCFEKGQHLLLLVEDLSFTTRDGFDRFTELVVAMNLVHERDHSIGWLEMVNQLAQT